MRYLHSVLQAYTLFFILHVSAFAAKPTTQSLSHILDTTLPKVVTIYVEHSYPPAAHIEQGRTVQNQGQSTGSGFFINGEGLVLTNAHVIKNAQTLVVRLYNGLETTAEVLGSDPATDIAIVQTGIKGTPFIALNDSQLPQIGDTVFAIGNGFNLPHTVTRGIVSALHRTVYEHAIEDFIQTDSSINIGNSGGPLIDSQGQLVGINNMIVGVAGGNNGVGFAIPTKIANNVATQIIRYGHTQPSQLGVVTQDITPALASALGSPSQKGAVISQVLPSSPAAQVGLRAKDIITAIDGQDISGSGQCRSLIYTKRAGSGMRIDILRSNKPLSFDVRTQSPDATAAAPTKESVLHGVTLVDHASLEQDHVLKGLRVVSVHNSSKAWLAGLQAGDIILRVNQFPVDKIELLTEISKKVKYPILLEVARGSTLQKLFLAISA